MPSLRRATAVQTYVSHPFASATVHSGANDVQMNVL